MHVKIAHSQDELNLVFLIRKEVFVEEQNVPLEKEIDEHDKMATHFILYNQKKATGTGRCRIFNDALKIERICILKDSRQSGAGRLLMQKIEDFARENNFTQLILNAQTQAKGFYSKLGFITISDEFIDEGIPHVSMLKNLIP